MFDGTPAPPTCAACSQEFTAKRKDQRFCSRGCQKNAARGPRDATHSPEAQGRNRLHYIRAAWLCHDLYKAPPASRLGIMAELIEAAREQDGQLRVILTDPRLLSAPPDSRIGKLYPDDRNPEVKNIAKAADAYCRAFWGHGVRDVVYQRCPTPPTGEGDDIEGHAPEIRLRTYRGKPQRAPDGFDYRASLGRPVCKGLRWFTVKKHEAAKLQALGGCQPRQSASALIEGHLKVA